MNLRILEIREIKSVPYAPNSRPYVERLIGTSRREYLEHTFLWSSIDLNRKYDKFRAYDNGVRVRRSRDRITPSNRARSDSSSKANLAHFAWEQHCNGLFESPVVA